MLVSGIRKEIPMIVLKVVNLTIPLTMVKHHKEKLRPIGMITMQIILTLI